ncbi:hypothetical protein SK128_001028, partial [Halocaridina rubra]
SVRHSTWVEGGHAAQTEPSSGQHGWQLGNYNPLSWSSTPYRTRDGQKTICLAQGFVVFHTSVDVMQASDGAMAKGNRNPDLLVVQDKFPICIEAVLYCPVWKDGRG